MNLLRTGRGMEWMVVFDRNMIIFVLVDYDTRQKMVYRVIISTEMKFLSAISCLADAKIADIRSTPIVGRTLVDGNNKGKRRKAATTGMCSGDSKIDEGTLGMLHGAGRTYLLR